MATPNVFIVHLRRPRSDDPRNDPFYEYGSFGCTGCHSWNLLNERHASELEGARLAFIQGGHGGTRLVFLTPPIKVTIWCDYCEAKWTPREMPFKYDKAPILIDNEGSTDFPMVMRFALKSRNKTIAGKPISLERRFSSKVRSRTSALEADVAKEIIAVYEKRRRARTSIAAKYYEGLPYTTAIDLDRKSTYANLIAELKKSKSSRCNESSHASEHSGKTCK